MSMIGATSGSRYGHTPIALSSRSDAAATAEARPSKAASRASFGSVPSITTTSKPLAARARAATGVRVVAPLVARHFDFLEELLPEEDGKRVRLVAP